MTCREKVKENLGGFNATKLKKNNYVFGVRLYSHNST